VEIQCKAGCSRFHTTDFAKTFSPVIRQESLCLLMALSVTHGLSLHQVNMTTAFLNGMLEDEVCMQQPKGFECQGKEELVCKLNNGSQQSPCCWNSTLDSYLKEM